jgi:hypothetical protein
VAISLGETGLSCPPIVPQHSFAARHATSAETS